jgi:hypothetical protein
MPRNIVTTSTTLVQLVFACPLVLLLSLTAFAQSAPQQATVWLYRPAADSLSSTMPLYVDGRKLVNFGHGQFFGIPLSPGLHAFSWTTQPGARQVVIPIGPDTQSYLEVTYPSNAPFLSINPMPPDKAIAAMNGVLPIDSSAVFDASVIVPAQRLQIAGTGSSVTSQPRALSTSAASAPPSSPSSAAQGLRQRSVEPEASRVGTAPTPSATASPASLGLTSAAGSTQRAETREEDEFPFRRFDIDWVLLSYNRQSQVSLYGGDLAFNTNINRRVGIVADVAIHQTVNEFPELRVTAYRFGPRIYVYRGRRISTFGEFLAGGARVTAQQSVIYLGSTITSSAYVNGFAAAVGGGMDFQIKPWLTWRMYHVDFSYLHIPDINSNGLRVGTGIAFQFGQ